MLVAVPVDEARHPLPCQDERGKALAGPFWPVFQSAKQRLRVRVVITDAGPAVRGNDAHGFQPCLEAVAFHRRAIVGVQHQRPGRVSLAQDSTLDQVSGKFTRLLGMHFPAHREAAKNVFNQVQLVELALHRALQPRHIP